MNKKDLYNLKLSVLCEPNCDIGILEAGITVGRVPLEHLESGKAGMLCLNQNKGSDLKEFAIAGITSLRSVSPSRTS